MKEHIGMVCALFELPITDYWAQKRLPRLSSRLQPQLYYVAVAVSAVLSRGCSLGCITSRLQSRLYLDHLTLSVILDSAQGSQDLLPNVLGLLGRINLMKRALVDVVCANRSRHFMVCTQPLLQRLLIVI